MSGALFESWLPSLSMLLLCLQNNQVISTENKSWLQNVNLIFDTNGLFLHFWNSRSVAKSYKRAAATALKSTNTYIVLSRYFIVPLFSRLFADDNFGVRKTSSSSSSSSYSSSTLCYSSKQSFSPSLWKKNWLRACYCYRYRAKQGRRKVWKSKGGGKVAFQGLLKEKFLLWFLQKYWEGGDWPSAFSVPTALQSQTPVPIVHAPALCLTCSRQAGTRSSVKSS